MPGSMDVFNDGFQSLSLVQLTENKGAFLAHLFGVTFHDRKVCTNGFREIDLVNHK